MGHSHRRRAVGREDPPHRICRCLLPHLLLRVIPFRSRLDDFQYVDLDSGYKSFWSELTYVPPLVEDDDAIRHTLKRADVEVGSIRLATVNAQKVKDEKGTSLLEKKNECLDRHGVIHSLTAAEPPKYFFFESTKGGLDYTVTSLGMPISLKTEYPASCLQPHTIKVRKGRTVIMKSESCHGYYISRYLSSLTN